MATSTLITARGKVTGVAGDVIHFAPSNTNYSLHLLCPGYSGPLNTPVDGVIRVKARKAYTMPSGGNFITPLFGPPRIIQGRVRSIDGNSVVLHAGAAIHVDLPAEASAVELANGAITVGGPMVNVVAFPGATFELAK